VSNLSDDVPYPEEPVNNENSTPSRVMLFTLLLLIAGFLLTGTMLLYYANAQRGNPQPMETGMEEPAPTEERSFFNKLGLSARTAEPDTAATNTNEGIMDQLFGQRNGSSVNWPRMKLVGFGTATDGSGGFAIINNHQYRQGDLISGKVKLIEIRRHDVLLEYGGETKTLSMDFTD
jgi:hypothetical protein